MFEKKNYPATKPFAAKFEGFPNSIMSICTLLVRPPPEMRSGGGEKNRARNLAPPERNPEYAPAWCSCIKTPKPPLTNTNSKEIFNFDEKLEKKIRN